jgi:hypothetical protein
MTGFLEKLQLLIDNGANVDVKTATSTLLQFACEHSCVSPTVTELLIRNVGDLNTIGQRIKISQTKVDMLPYITLA